MTLQKLGVKLGVAYTTPDFTLGTLHVTPAGDHYRFLQADGAVVANVMYSWQGTTYQIEDKLEVAVTPATAENIALCVSSVALADNEYAWVFVGPGNFTATAAEDIAVDVNLFGHATAGAIGDTASACLLKGVVAQTIILSGATGTFHAAYPLMAEDLN